MKSINLGETTNPLDEFSESDQSVPSRSSSTQSGHEKRRARKRLKIKPSAASSKEGLRIQAEILNYLAASGLTDVDPWAVYDLDKAKAGLRPSEVRRIDRIGAWAVAHMQKPMGFHLEIYPSDEEYLVKNIGKLPKWLERFGQRYATAGASWRVLFAYKTESSRGDKVHVHLYCIVDSWDRYRADTLKNLLAARLLSEVRLIRRKPIYDGNEYVVFDPDSGEQKRHGRTAMRPWRHFLKTDFEDWRRRTTYAAKNHTRKDIGKFRSFHCSRVILN